MSTVRKAGYGPPRKPQELTVTVEAEWCEELRAAAFETRRHRTSLIREAIREFLDRRAVGKDFARFAELDRKAREAEESRLGQA